MTPEQLAIIGDSTLSPDRWQSPLARILGINLRTLQRYASGESPIPPDVAARLYMMVDLAEIAAARIGKRGILEFFRWVKTVSVHGVPDHLDPIELRALARLLRRPRDWTRDRFQWSEL